MLFLHAFALLGYVHIPQFGSRIPPAADPLEFLQESPASGVRVLNQATNAIVLNPATRKLWATVPGDALKNPNTVIEIDPASGMILRKLSVGKNNIEEPNRPTALAISDDGSAMYVSLVGAPMIRRIDPITLATVKETSLPRKQWPFEMKVQPGHPDVLVMTLFDTDDSGNYGPFVVANGVIQPKSLGVYHGTSITFLDPTTLYSVNTRMTPADVYRSLIGADGVTEDHQFRGAVGGGVTRLTACGSRLYTASGVVLDANTCIGVGKFPVTEAVSVAVDVPKNRAFFLRYDPQNAKGMILEAFDLSTYASCGQLRLKSFTQEPVYTTNDPSLMRIGSTGLVARSGYGIYFIDHAPGL